MNLKECLLTFNADMVNSIDVISIDNNLRLYYFDIEKLLNSKNINLEKFKVIRCIADEGHNLTIYVRNSKGAL